MTQPLDLARHHRLENLLASTLQRGTCAACTIIGLGLIFNAASIGASNRIGSLLALTGIAFFLLLPVIRVLMMILIFLGERDYAFAIISTTVLAVIGISAAVGAVASNFGL